MSGFNDVRDGSIPDETVGNIERCLTDLKNKFPNAKVAFTEIIYVGAENSHPDLNKAIKYINQQVQNFCENSSLVFIKHPVLQAAECNMYDDDVHINVSGTAVFVHDVHKAIGLYQNSRPNRHRMFNREPPRRSQNHSSRGGSGAWQGRRQQHSDTDGGNNQLNQMNTLLTLQMMQSMQPG